MKEGFGFHDGLFSGYDPAKRTYDTATWAYEGDQAATAAFERTQKEIAAHGQGPPTNAGAGVAIAKRDMRLEHPRSRVPAHEGSTTPATRRRWSSDITGIPKEQFLEIAKLVGEMGRPDKVMTIVYAVGLTHHTTGGQLIRSAAVLQLLLGNMGRPGGGMNAERGHANIQGNTDHAISWEILPGYLRIPAPGQKNLDDYVQQSAPKKFDANSWNFFGTNYRNFMVSLLKGWYGDAATTENEYAFDFVPEAGVELVVDLDLRPGAQGEDGGRHPLGDDRDQHRARLQPGHAGARRTSSGSSSWTRCRRRARSSGGGRARIRRRSRPRSSWSRRTHWIEKDGSFVNSGRWMQWKDAVIPPEGEARHDHWILAEVFQRVKKLYQQHGRQVPRAAHGADHEVQGPDEARARRDRPGDQRLRPDDRASGSTRSPS